jgi:hypothetical protein
MLNTKDGITRAVEMVSRSVKNGQDGGLTLLIFLTNLAKERPHEYLSLLKEILIAEDLKPGSFSMASLYLLKSLFLKNEIPLDMKLRFLAIVVSSAERISSQINPDDVVTAYQLLRDVYGEIEGMALGGVNGEIGKLVTPLYRRARTVTPMLVARVPARIIEREAVQSRVERSGNPLRQLIMEADSTTNDSDKDDLRTQAAHVALERGELEIK